MVCTFTISDAVVLGCAGSRAQLETSSTGLNGRSENGRCMLIVALIYISMWIYIEIGETRRKKYI